MMTRPEFDAFWVPLLNAQALKRGMAPVTLSEMDGLWHNYIQQQSDQRGWAYDDSEQA